MKKSVVVLLVLFALALPAYAEDYNWLANPTMPLQGVYGPTLKYTMTSDTAVSVQTAYAAGTWTRVSDGTTYVPIGVLITCETNAGRFSLGSATATVDGVGHVLATGNSVRIIGMGAVAGMKITNSTAGSNAVFQITPEYQK